MQESSGAARIPGRERGRYENSLAWPGRRVLCRRPGPCGLRIRRDESGGLPSDASLFEIVADFERHTIIEKLEGCDWSQTAAAEAFRVPLSTLNQKIKRLNIDVRRRGGQ